jgi:hypothetical protein
MDTKSVGKQSKSQASAKHNGICKTDLSVILSGPFLSHSGFSKMNRELAFGLTKRGVTVKVEICDTRIEVDEKTKEAIDRLVQVTVKPKTPKIYSMTMPSLISSDGPRILFTMMESSNGLHKDYAEKMNLASEIWVPTTHMTDIMQEAGVCSPVHIVPLGVDKNIFSESSGIMPLTKNARNFRFLSVSWWGPRKGFDILIKAFVGEFAEDEDVCLVISSRSHDNKPASKIAEEIKQIIASTGHEEHAPVILHSKVTTDKELASLYNACDAFVLASRGEGFALTIVEAASCGLPVISTNCTAQETYLDDSNSYLLEPESYEKANPQDGRASNVGRWCKYYENQLFPVFGGKSIRRLGELMRDVYQNRSDAQVKASVLTSKVRSSMTWDNTIDTVIARLSAIANKQGEKA